MNSICSLGLLMSLFVSPLIAQSSAPTQGFSFKGNYLGMSLAAFRVANATDQVYVNTGNSTAFGRPNKKYTTAVPTPLCTDQMRGFPGDPGVDLAEGEVACNVSPGNANPDGLVVAGAPVISVIYRFYNGRLHHIQISFIALEYSLFSSAFKAKYGVPTARQESHYQNGFGANWVGEDLGWSSGSQSIALIEGAGNGPGQDNTNIQHPSTAVFDDFANEPSRPKSAQDF